MVHCILFKATGSIKGDFANEKHLNQYDHFVEMKVGWRVGGSIFKHLLSFAPYAHHDYFRFACRELCWRVASWMPSLMVRFMRSTSPLP